MTGIGFDPAVTGDLTSLKVFFTNDPRWAGKVDFLTEMRDAIGLTMLSLGLDPTQPTRDDCDKSTAAIQAAKDAGIIRAFKGNDYSQDLSAGDAVLVMAWSGDMVQVLVDKPGSSSSSGRGRHDLVGQHDDPQGRCAGVYGRAAHRLVLHAGERGGGHGLRQLHLPRQGGRRGAQEARPLRGATTR